MNDIFDEPIYDNRPAAGQKSNILVIILILIGAMILGCGGILIALLLPAVEQGREAARRSMSKNNLKQIGLAMHNYHDVYGVLPPGAILSEHGTAHQGWEYSILPFVDQAPLFNQIDSDLPWNSPQNISLYKYEVEVYLNPALEQRSDTAGFGYAHYAGNSHIFEPNRSWSFSEVADGLSNTLMAGEVKDNLMPWGAPGNVRDPALGINKGPDTFGSPFQGGAQFLLMDGSVRFLSENIDPAALKALATPAGEEDMSRFRY
ncbi:MAG: DUF1559 domain-containing protein [Planctomycetaceae bacterium]|nr:DUF1559 domain-containing protein [Planctomycetaceae bacterium]